MATKKFAQMSTKKLNALLETASEEDAQAIQAILESRNAIQTAPAPENTELSEEEQAAITAAETAAAAVEGEEKKEKNVKGAGRKASPKMSNEELEETHEKAKKNLGHRVETLLPRTVIKVGGTIIGILKDKRAMQVYYQIKTDEIDDMESRTIYKKFGSEEVTILEEVVELKKKAEAKARQVKAKMEAGEWDAEAAAVIETASKNVGKTIDLGENGEGRIISLLNDKRSCGIYYRIEFTDENGAKKFCHKVVNYDKDENGAIELAQLSGLADELDEAGQEINDAYQERKTREPRKVLTPEEKVLKAEEELKKAEATLAKAQETLIMRQNTLALAKAELENKFNAQAEFAGGTNDEDLA